MKLMWQMLETKNLLEYFIINWFLQPAVIFTWYISENNYYSFLGKYSYKVVPLWTKTCLYCTSSLVTDDVPDLYCTSLLVQKRCPIHTADLLSYCTVYSWVLLHSCWQIWEFYLFGQKLRKWHKNHSWDMKLVVLSSFPCWNGKHKIL